MAIPCHEYGGFQCLLSVPATHAAATHPLPLLLFLHGRDEAAPLDIQHALRAHSPLHPGAAPDSRERFIIAAPQLAAPGGDVWLRHAAQVRDIARALHRELGADPRRTYLTGFSFGGNGALDIGALQPHMWAAIWAVDPTRLPALPFTRPVRLSAGACAAPLRQAFQLHPATPAAHDAPRVYEYVDPGHTAAARIAYGTPANYGWLMEHALPAG
jgi:poly(3-hydroxybutyrate) depolymerase